MPSSNKPPHFDFLEITLERDFLLKPYKPLSPVKVGNVISSLSFSKDFGRWQQFVNGAGAYAYIPHQQLISKPLVIAFYSEHWGKHGLAQLLDLNQLQHGVKLTGGNLVVISPEREESLGKLAWENSLSLNFYFDHGKEMAETFRVYSEYSPAWNLFSGVDVNVPLMATYVLNPAGHVVYHHINRDFTDTFSVDDVLSAVHESGGYKTKLRSA